MVTRDQKNKKECRAKDFYRRKQNILTKLLMNRSSIDYKQVKRYIMIIL